MAFTTITTGMYRNALNISANDTTEYQPPLDMLYIGGQGGTVVVLTENGQEVWFENVIGEIPVRVKKVLVTDTSGNYTTDATNIIGFW